MTELELRVFLDDYRAAFQSRDAEAIAEYFVYPCHVTSDDETIRLAAAVSREAWIEQVEGVLGLYEKVGVARARISDITVLELSARIVHTRVGWSMLDAVDAELYRFQATYTLASESTGIRIAAIAHNELPRLLGLLGKEVRPPGVVT